MNFQSYSKEFREQAKDLEYEDEYIERCIEYARNLIMNKIPIIYDQEHLGKLLGVKLEYLYGVSNNSTPYYRKFEIKKKSGKIRTIHEPLPLLKEIQKWIYVNILSNVEVSRYAKGYVKGLSIKDNAKFHKRQKKVLCMDIKEYFPSISEWKVYNLFISLGYREEVAMMLCKLCTYEGYLPQGAPTSPILSNIITKKLDEKIFDICIKINANIRYSRYADDMTFSGDFDQNILIKEIRRVAYEEGFKINDLKTRVSANNKCQKVTGIVVNEKLQISRQDRDKVRQEVYYLCKYGIKEHLKKITWKKSEKEYITNLKGRINFILFINPKDAKVSKVKEELKRYLKLTT